MPRGSKAKYSSKQKRQARHIEEGYRRSGASRQRAGRIGWATVNKQDGGARAGRAAGAKTRPSTKASTRRAATAGARRARTRPGRSRQAAARASH